MNNVQRLLEEELNTRLKKLRTMESGTDEYKNEVETIAKLVDRVIEFEKIYSDCQMKTVQIEETSKSEKLKNYIEIGKAVGGFGLAAWAFVASMNFEKEGTFTTEGGRTALRNLLKFIK